MNKGLIAAIFLAFVPTAFPAVIAEDKLVAPSQSFSGGSFSFTPPPGVFQVRLVMLAGGGGGGRYTNQPATCNRGTYGGGAGEYVDLVVPVTPGIAIPISVSTGALGATVDNTAGMTANDTSFGTYIAKGGKGGNTYSAAGFGGNGGGSCGGAGAAFNSFAGDGSSIGTFLSGSRFCGGGGGSAQSGGTGCGPSGIATNGGRASIYGTDMSGPIGGTAGNNTGAGGSGGGGGSSAVAQGGHGQDSGVVGKNSTDGTGPGAGGGGGGIDSTGTATDGGKGFQGSLALYY